MLLWLASVLVSVGLLVACAGMRAASVGWAWAFMGIAALTCIGLALAAVTISRAQAAAAAKEALVAATATRAIGMVWLWVAMVMTATYATGVLVWWEWWHFAIAATAAAALCLFFERSLTADAQNAEADDTMTRFAETIGMIQFAGMGLTLAGLLIDGKMTRFLTPRYTDWAANVAFFCGALAIVIISANDIMIRRKYDESGS